MAVSVVIPVRNRPEMLQRALQSIKTQTVPVAEVIVVDDASTDGTPEVALASGATLVRMPGNSGSGPARNAGIEVASTEWVAFLDSDDEWLPKHCELLLDAAKGRVLVTAPSVNSVGQVMGNSWRRRYSLDPRRILVPGNVITTSGTMVRRDVLDHVDGFRALPRAQDLDLWLRVLECGPGLALARPTVVYHHHAEQASVDRDITDRVFDEIIEEYAGRPWLTSRTREQAYARVHWDKFRAARQAGERDTSRAHLAWLRRRPATWWPLVQLFAARRAGRYPLGGVPAVRRG